MATDIGWKAQIFHLTLPLSVNLGILQRWLDAKARMMDVPDGDGDTCYHFDTILEYDGRSGGDGRSEYSTSMSRFTIHDGDKTQIQDT